MGTQVPINKEVEKKSVNDLRFIIFVLLLGPNFDRLLWLYDSVAVAVGYVVGSTQISIRVYVTIATVRHAVRAAVLVVELSVRTHVVTETV